MGCAGSRLAPIATPSTYHVLGADAAALEGVIGGQGSIGHCVIEASVLGS